MGKKQCVLLILFITVSAIPTTSFGMQHSQTDKEIYTTNIIEKGGYIIRDNITLLYVNGTNYEMGYQHGFFLREKVQENLRAFLDYSWYPYDELLVIWNQMKPFVPKEYLDEMQGLADGADVEVDDIAAAYMVIVVGDLGGCFGISTWGDATRDGELIHTRSFDQPMDIQDP
ncbi:MAG: hypothetical protein QCH96_07365, partial [Candidatus Thermoplasmatota archaeon]|nr:hypothetical protein [Candidatus Thermoplasmatota archaeon]